MLRSQKNNDAPVKLLFSSIWDLPKKIVSLRTELNLSSGFDSDKYEALSFQLETIRLSENCTIALIKHLLDTVNKLSEDVAVLKGDNASLKSQINKLHENSFNRRDHCRPVSVYRQARKPLTHLHRPHFGIQPGSMPPLQILDLRILLHIRNNLLIEELPWKLHQLTLRVRLLPSKKTVTYRKKTIIESPAVITVKHRRQPRIGVRNSVSLPVIAKKQRFKAPSFSGVSLQVTADNAEKSQKSN
jgi:hypothetical protein